MKSLNRKVIYFTLFAISAIVLCFEIIATRISSVIFVSNYAFMILSLAILGLGTGGVFSYYRLKQKNNDVIISLISKYIFAVGLSIVLFILAVLILKISNPYFYFLLLFIPFFLAGIVYSQIFKMFAEQSFLLYAADLAGSALGAALSVLLLNLLAAPNAIVLMGAFVFCTSILFRYYTNGIERKKAIILVMPFFILLVIISLSGRSSLIGSVTIGKFQEKDYYYVYPDAADKATLLESRWSSYGRTDLIKYNDQDFVRHLFIDGAAGTPLYRFNGNPEAPGQMLLNVLVSNSTAIPFTFLHANERDNMLAIGPGGGKEILMGLLMGVSDITGVEVNPDFVELVKEYKDFDGGIYTDFPNVKVLVREGRHYIKSTKGNYDLIVMALPSTEQLQSIDNFAASENYLLTVEAISDYLNILTDEGQMIFTVHNRWELTRLIVTACKAFEMQGISPQEVLNHIIILASGDFAPTIVIKKNAYSGGEVAYIKSVTSNLSRSLPGVTYLPYNLSSAPGTVENGLLRAIQSGQMSIEKYVEQSKFDISPVYDDSPYFYKVTKSIPDDYLWLLICVGVFSAGIIYIPYSRFRKNKPKVKAKSVLAPLGVFASIGLGFMILEVSLFQKLILYLGSPTMSLSVLLGSLLVSMGLGSYFGNKFLVSDLIKKIRISSIAIIIYGVILFIVLPDILDALLVYGQLVRLLVTVVFVLPFGIMLGIPFPTALRIMRESKLEEQIPWMYGVNGIMSVLGSVLAVIISMLYGFTPAFSFGLCMYLLAFAATTITRKV